VRIKLPAEFKVDELPKSARIDSAFWRYFASWSRGHVATFSVRWRCRRRPSPPAQYAELKKFLDSIGGSAEDPWSSSVSSANDGKSGTCVIGRPCA